MVQVEHFMSLSTLNRGREKKTPLSASKTLAIVILLVNNYLLSACYFNSLLQIYFTIPAFVTAILSYKECEDVEENVPQNNNKKEDGKKQEEEKVIDK